MFGATQKVWDKFIWHRKIASKLKKCPKYGRLRYQSPTSWVLCTSRASPLRLRKAPLLSVKELLTAPSSARNFSLHMPVVLNKIRILFWSGLFVFEAGELYEVLHIENVCTVSLKIWWAAWMVLRSLRSAICSSPIYNAVCSKSAFLSISMWQFSIILFAIYIFSFHLGTPCPAFYLYCILLPLFSPICIFSHFSFLFL